jgi:hypothetical protein
MASSRGDQRALQVLSARFNDTQLAAAALQALAAAGIGLADLEEQELVCRWVNVLERAVPPDADTIIRTITRGNDGHSTVSSHWLDGLHGPRLL